MKLAYLVEFCSWLCFALYALTIVLIVSVVLMFIIVSFFIIYVYCSFELLAGNSADFYFDFLPRSCCGIIAVNGGDLRRLQFPL